MYSLITQFPLLFFLSLSFLSYFENAPRGGELDPKRLNSDAFKIFMADVLSVSPGYESTISSFNYYTKYYEKEYKGHNMVFMSYYDIGQYYFDKGVFPEEGYFDHFIPVVNREGELPILLDGVYTINENSAQKELAWELIKYMMEKETDNWLSGLSVSRLRIPIQKTRYEECVSATLIEKLKFIVPDGLSSFKTGSDQTSLDKDAVREAYKDELDTAIAKMTAHLSLPMSPYGYYLSSDIYSLSVRLENREITVDVYADQLQRKMEEYFSEE